MGSWAPSSSCPTQPRHFHWEVLLLVVPRTTGPVASEQVKLIDSKGEQSCKMGRLYTGANLVCVREVDSPKPFLGGLRLDRVWMPYDSDKSKKPLNLWIVLCHLWIKFEVLSIWLVHLVIDTKTLRSELSFHTLLCSHELTWGPRNHLVISRCGNETTIQRSR